MSDNPLLNSNTSTNGNTTVYGDLSVNGNININNDLNVRGRLNVRQYTNTNIINTNVTNYNLTVSEDISLNGRLFVGGNIIYNGVEIDTVIGGGIGPTGPVFSGNIIYNHPLENVVFDNDSFYYLSVSDNPINNISSSNGDLSLNGRLFVGGNIIYKGVEIDRVIGGGTGPTGSAGPIGPVGPVFSGNVTYNHPLENVVFDNESFYYLSVNDSSTNNITTEGDLSINGNVNIKYNLKVEKDVSLNGRLFVGGNIIYNGVDIKNTIGGGTGPTGQIGPVFSGNITYNHPLENVVFDNDSFYYLSVSDNPINNISSSNGDLSLNGRLFVGGNIIYKGVEIDSVIGGGIGPTGPVFSGNVTYNHPLENVVFDNDSFYYLSVSDNPINNISSSNGDLSLNGRLFVGGNIIYKGVEIDSVIGGGTGPTGSIGPIGPVGPVFSGNVTYNHPLENVVFDNESFYYLSVSDTSSNGDLSLNKRLFVGGDVSLNSNLYMGGNIFINGVKLLNNGQTGPAGPTGQVGPVFSGNVLLMNPIENITFDTESFYYMNLNTSSNYDSNISGNANILRNITVNGICHLSGGISSTSTGTGSLIVTGGAGISANLYVGGTCFVNGTQVTSDYRIKENIKNLGDSYNVNNLRVVNYFNNKTKTEDVGLIAHELQEHYPFLVTGEKDGDELQSINYIGIIGILIREIQILKEKVFAV